MFQTAGDTIRLSVLRREVAEIILFQCSGDYGLYRLMNSNKLNNISFFSSAFFDSYSFNCLSYSAVYNGTALIFPSSLYEV